MIQMQAAESYIEKETQGLWEGKVDGKEDPTRCILVG
jgi:hypothetical protein